MNMHCMSLLIWKYPNILKMCFKKCMAYALLAWLAISSQIAKIVDAGLQSLFQLSYLNTNLSLDQISFPQETTQKHNNLLDDLKSWTQQQKMQLESQNQKLTELQEQTNVSKLQFSAFAFHGSLKEAMWTVTGRTGNSCQRLFLFSVCVVTSDSAPVHQGDNH